MDPLAAQTPGLSPYISFVNSPTNFVDPDGRSAWSEFVDTMHQRMSGIEEGTVEGDPFTLGQDLAVYKIIEGFNTLASMTYEDWANAIESITLDDLNPGKVMEATATKTVEEAAPAFLSEDPYQRDLARGQLFQNTLVAVSAELVGSAPGLTVARPRPASFPSDLPDVGGARISRTTGTAITWTEPDVSTIRPMENEFIDDLVAKTTEKRETIYRAEPYTEELVVPLMRPGTADIRRMPSSARIIASERGARVVSLGRMTRFPEAEKVTFFGHANPYVLGRRTPDILHNALGDLRPETLELAGCNTLPCGALGPDLLAPRLHQLSGATILGYPREVSTMDLAYGRDRVKFSP